MADFVKMIKDGEEKPVHPGNVQSHLRQGWQLAGAPEEQPVVEYIAVSAEMAMPEDEPEAEIPAESPVVKEEVAAAPGKGKGRGRGKGKAKL